MKGKPPVQINGAVGFAGGRYCNGGTHVVIGFLRKRHDDIEAVCGTALENRNDNFLSSTPLFGRSRQPSRCNADSCHGDSGGFKEITTRDHGFISSENRAS